MYKESAEKLNIETNVNLDEIILRLFKGSLNFIKSNQTFQDKMNEVVHPGGPTEQGMIELEKSQKNFDDCIKRACETNILMGRNINGNN